MNPSPPPLVHHLRRLAASGDAAPDALLLERFTRERDEGAFATLVARHGPLVLGVCRRLLADRHAAEDAFQATFLVLARRAESLRDPAGLPGWLHAVAVRVALRGRRSARRRRTVQPPADAPEPASAHPTPLAELTVSELLTALDEEVSRLPEAYRLPVILCALQGHSQEEAARRLGWTTGSVRGRLQRGRKRLHARLARRGFTLSAVLDAAEVVRAAGTAPPRALAAATARAALLFATNASPPAGSVPARVTALAQGVLTTMLCTRMQFAALAALVCTAAALVAGLAGRSAWATAPAPLAKGEPPGPARAVPGPAPRGDAQPRTADDAGARRLQGGGSVLTSPLMARWAAAYARATGVRIDYAAIGSGAGLRQVSLGVVDFGCTDVPLSDAQRARARADQADLVPIPLALWAVVPIYNLENVPPLRFSGPVLADIYLGNIRTWNDPALQRLNPGARLPDKDITVVRRSDGSSCTSLWTDYLSKVSPAWQRQVGAGVSVRWPGGLGAKGDAGVANVVGRSSGGIGYVSLSYALQHQTPYGLVENRAGAFVRADLKSIAAAAAASAKGLPPALRQLETDAPGKDSYPITGLVLAIVSDRMPQARRQALGRFLRWATHEGQVHTEEAHQGRLPRELFEHVAKQLERLQGGQ
jgi:phosphate transport system substrate-binding protein